MTTTALLVVSVRVFSFHGSAPLDVIAGPVVGRKLQN